LYLTQPALLCFAFPFQTEIAKKTTNTHIDASNKQTYYYYIIIIINKKIKTGKLKKGFRCVAKYLIKTKPILEQN